MAIPIGTKNRIRYLSPRPGIFSILVYCNLRGLAIKSSVLEMVSSNKRRVLLPGIAYSIICLRHSCISTDIPFIGEGLRICAGVASVVSNGMSPTRVGPQVLNFSAASTLKAEKDKISRLGDNRSYCIRVFILMAFPRISLRKKLSHIKPAERFICLTFTKSFLYLGLASSIALSTSRLLILHRPMKRISLLSKSQAGHFHQSNFPLCHELTL